MSTHAIFKCVVVAAAVALLTAGAWAGILKDDPNAYTDGSSTTWRGRVEFRGVLMGLWWAADVEYAVYAPGGSFTTSWPGATDPSSGQHFIYAYQIFNDLGIDPEYPYPSGGPGMFGTKDKEHVTTLSIGINGSDEEVANIGYIAATGVKDPTYSEINPSSVFWEFIGGTGGANQINYGDTSDVLLFSSPHGPELDYATLSGEVPDEGFLPSPAPEPATIAILAIGALALWTQTGRKFASSV